MSNTVHISLCFGSESHQIGELSSHGGRSILAIHSLPFPIPGMAVGTTQFLDNTPPFWIQDVLPDAWGELVLRYSMKNAGIQCSAITLANKLSFIGDSGLGAWQFQPAHILTSCGIERDVKWLHEQALKLLKHQTDVDLAWMAGSLSLGGTRPKLFVDLVDGHVSLNRQAKDRDWILKFPGVSDAADSGNWEYLYARIAYKYGINIQPPLLVNGKYFATRRFDMSGIDRFLVCTLSNINQKSHTDSLGNSYESAIDAIPDFSAKRLRQYLRLAVFNLVMLNCDDHAKNISYLIDKHGKIKDAPFYDLTYSPSLGIHGISLNGESWFKYLDVVEGFSVYGLSAKEIRLAISDLQDVLALWSLFAQEASIEVSDQLNQRKSEIFLVLSQMASASASANRSMYPSRVKN